MPRTNTGAVQEILIEDYDGELLPNLTPFLETANAVVSRAVTYASDNGGTITSTEAELMERWLAAHFYCCSDQPLAETQSQRSKGVFQGRTGMYLEGTKYGQAALNLDFTGALAAVTSQNSVSVHWLGSTEPEQLTYDERN